MQLLKQLSIHPVSNPWFELDYGANAHGLLAATPADMMHLFDLGILPYVIEVFFNSMTNSVKARLDDLVSRCFQAFRSSENNHGIRVDFTNGITSISMLTAKEWPGFLFVLFHVLLMEEGIAICQKCFQENDIQVDAEKMEACMLGYDSSQLADVPDACNKDYVYVEPNRGNVDANDEGNVQVEIMNEIVVEVDDSENKDESNIENVFHVDIMDPKENEQKQRLQ